MVGQAVRMRHSTVDLIVLRGKSGCPGRASSGRELARSGEAEDGLRGGMVGEGQLRRSAGVMSVTSATSVTSAMSEMSGMSEMGATSAAGGDIPRRIALRVWGAGRRVIGGGPSGESPWCRAAIGAPIYCPRHIV